MNLLTWLMAHAPEPTADQIESQKRFDGNRNKYNEPHKPKLRDRNEIIVDLKLVYSETLLTCLNSLSEENTGFIKSDQWERLNRLGAFEEIGSL